METGLGRTPDKLQRTNFFSANGGGLRRMRRAFVPRVSRVCLGYLRRACTVEMPGLDGRVAVSLGAVGDISRHVYVFFTCCTSVAAFGTIFGPAVPL